MQGECPRKIGKFDVVAHAVIQRPTLPDPTRHTADQSLAAVVICQYPGDWSYFVFRCDEGWQPWEDSWHQCLEEALTELDRIAPSASQHLVFATR